MPTSVTTYTWIGDAGSALPVTSAANWTPAGPPTSGSPAIANAGTLLMPADATLNGNTLYLESATLVFANDTNVTYTQPTLDQATTVTTDVSPVEAVPGTAQQTVLDAYGVFVNDGTIEANGPAGSSFTLAIDGTTIAGTYVPGTFINYGQIQVDAGNSMTITVGGTAELFNVGDVTVNGGTLVFAAATGAIAGGYAPVIGTTLIRGGGTLETNAAYASTVTGTAPLYAFGDSTAGNTLRIDNIGSFGGRVLGFGQGDTIDLGTSLAVGKLAYSSSSGVLALENAGGTILASLVLASGAFENGTFTVAGGVAGSFGVGTGADGNTILTTSVQNSVWGNSSGVWQSAAGWGGSVPGTLDTALLGVGANAPFVLTTGSTPVTIGALVLGSGGATLQVTSNTTIVPYIVQAFSGTLEVTSGNTLTASAIRQIRDAVVTVDADAVLDLLGHSNAALAAANGTISIPNSNTIALALNGGTLLVNGGTLNAGPTQAAGNGGAIFVGYDGAGTPGVVTVQSSGSAAAVVTDTRAVLSSDPTSFGQLTLNGQVTWTDKIDPHDSLTSTGNMVVGTNNEASNMPAGVAPPPYAAAAQLLIENGATLIEENFATIGGSVDSAGAATVETGGLWNIAAAGAGFLNVGSAGLGTLSVLSGGTVAVGNQGIGVGASAFAHGTITVSGAGSKLTDAGGFNIGKAGQGAVAILNGGSVEMTGSSGITIGNTAGAVGTLLVSGTDAVSHAAAVLTFDPGSKGITVGGAGNGTLTVQAGGTIAMNGTGGIAVGASLGAVGILVASGAGAVINQGTAGNGMGIGQAGTGYLSIQNGGSVGIAGGGVGIGTSAGGTGTVLVGTNAKFSVASTTTGFSVGSGGSGLLDVEGGTVTAGSGLAIAAGSLASATGTVLVNGGSLGIAGGLTVGGKGSGSLTVQGGGTVTQTGTVGLNVGFNAGSTGTVSVANGTLSTAGGLMIGNAGTGSITVGVGGLFTATGTTGLDIGGFGGGTAAMVVDGGIFTTNGAPLFIGNGANASLLVENAGAVITTYGSIGPAVDINATGIGQASVTVTGTASVWQVIGSGAQFVVGDNGSGALAISAGGLVNAGTLTVDIGNQNGGSGTVTVGGGGARLQGGNLVIANALTGTATGRLSVDAGGTVSVSNLTVGSGGTLALAGGLIGITSPLSPNNGLVTGYGTLSGGISDSGTIVAAGGTLDITGGIIGNGAITIAGTSALQVDGLLGSSLSVSFATDASTQTLILGAPNVGANGFALGNWQNGDELAFSNGATVSGVQWFGGASSGTLEVATSAGTYDFTNVSLAGGTTPIFTTGSNFVELVSCFAAGTRIRTPAGDVAVEALAVGELVCTGLGGKPAPVVWIGHRHVACDAHPAPSQVWPVRIAAGAFGPAQPARDLLLSPDHAVYVDGVLIPVKRLVNGRSIVQVPTPAVTYYHVELPRHDVVFAEGLPTESYLDVGDRANFANGGAVVRLHVGFTETWEAEGCAPLVVVGPTVAAARARLAVRAADLAA